MKQDNHVKRMFFAVGREVLELKRTAFGDLVLDEGKCVGMGTHEELLKNCEVYKEIALSQLSEEELFNA